MGGKATPVKSVEAVAQVHKIQRKVVQAGNVVVLDEKHPHIRNNRDGTVIKLDVNSGVCTMDVRVCLDEIGAVFFFSSWQGQRGSSVTNKLVRPRTKCSSESGES